MILQETITDDTLTIKILGDIDIHMMLAFRERIVLFMDKNPVDLVLDLEGVNNLNSSALGILLRLHKHQKSVGRNLTIKNTAGRIKELLKFSSLAQAIA